MIQKRIALFILQINGKWEIPAGTVMLIPIERGHTGEHGMSEFVGVSVGCF